MSLFLVRHGRSLPKDVDPDQGLSGEGITDTTRMAETAMGHNIRVRLIQHSEKTRARQTAEIFASALRPRDGVHEIAGLKPLDDVEPIAETVFAGDDTMLVGHLPFMERLAAYLITGSVTPTVIQFQNSVIVCLDKAPETQLWTIRWAVLPDYE